MHMYMYVVRDGGTLGLGPKASLGSMAPLVP